jgi:dipeptidyl aminopeptidase/acylaminoacyl peptidase
MKRIAWRSVTLGLLLMTSGLGWLKVLPHQMSVAAQEGRLTLPPRLEAQGIPPVPLSLVRQVRRYLGAYGMPLAGWHPEKRELWLKAFGSTAWVSRLEAPGATPKIWIHLLADGVYDFYFQPQLKQLLYNRDVNGDEAFQLYRYDLATKVSTPLSTGKSRNTEFVWSRAGEQVAFSFAPAQGIGVSLALVNPFDPESQRVLVASTGHYLKAYDWSPDDKYLVYGEFLSITQSKLWLVEVANGQRRLLRGEQANELGYYSGPRFRPDGQGLYFITDAGADVRYLAYLNLATGQFQKVTPPVPWELDEYALAPDGKTIALAFNQAGLTSLQMLDVHTGKLRIIESAPRGVLEGLRWHPNARELAFNVKATHAPNDVYSYEVETGQSVCWSKSVMGELDAVQLAPPELIQWKSFDGRTITGFIARPPASFKGKRPVIIDLHGGPAEQYRPEYGYEDNYYSNELGVVKIYPNVRGSKGFGKAFQQLDDGARRADAVKDVGALLDWIKTQPDLDAERVLVQGGSYGGFLALATAVQYSARLRGVIADAAVANLATFVSHTEGWRRDVQRLEFGDEREPHMRALMERTAPLNNLQKITIPLLVIHGKNDPRHPASEAATLVQAARQRKLPVWYLLAQDEGHDFVKPANRNYKIYTKILFVKEYLLN